MGKLAVKYCSIAVIIELVSKLFETSAPVNAKPSQDRDGTAHSAFMAQLRTINLINKLCSYRNSARGYYVIFSEGVN